jgi:hypothetical protein
MARELQDGNDEARVPRERRPYVAPELVEYGSIAKLTQSGSITMKDFGNMKQTGP